MTRCRCTASRSSLRAPGCELSRRTMADWMIAASEACAQLMKLLEAKVRSGPLLQLDETRLQVLGEPGRANTALSYMWVARAGPPEAPVILYHYAPSRGTEVAVEMLGDYKGYVQTDGYEVYDRACDGAKNVVHVGCFAHARRMFHDAHKNSKKAGSAEEALATNRPTVPHREPTGALQGSAEVCGRTTSAGRANSGGVSHLAGTPSRSGSSRDVAGQGGRLHVGAVAQAHSLPGSPGDRSGYQRVREGHKTLCARTQLCGVQYYAESWGKSYEIL